MASLQKPLATVTGANKTVIDSGPLINPTLNVLSGVNSVVNFGKDVYESKKKKEEQERQRTRQEASDKRAENSEARAQEDQIFQKEDRAKASALDDFKDDAAASMRRINQKKLALKQNPNGRAALDIVIDAETTGLLQRHPTMSHELNQYYKDNNLSHLLLQGVRDEEKDRVDQAQSQRDREEAAIDIVFSRGLAAEGTPREDVIRLGQRVQAEEANIAQIEKQMGILKNKTDIDESSRKTQLAMLDRQVYKSSMNQTNVITGAAYEGILQNVKSVETPEQFQAVVAQAPIVKAQLEQQRSAIKANMPLGMSTQEVDESFNNALKLLDEVTTGDLSYAKQRANRISSIQSSAQLDMYEALPAMAQFEALPQGFQKSMENAELGTILYKELGMEQFVMDMGAYISGVKTEGSEAAGEAMDALKNGKEVMDVAPYARIQTLNGYRVAMMNDAKAVVDTDKTSIEPFLSSQARIINAGKHSILSNQDTLEASEILNKELFGSAALNANEAAISNPATEEIGKQNMLASRVLASKSLDSLMKHSSDPNWKIKYSKEQGKYVSEFTGDGVLNKFKPTNSPQDYYLQNGEGFDKSFARAQRDGPGAGETRRLKALNNTLDYLTRTQMWDESINPRTSPNDYREYLATGNASKLEVVNSSKLLAIAEEPVPSETTEAPRANGLGMAQTSTYKTNSKSFGKYMDSAAESYRLPSALIHAMADAETGHISDDAERASNTNEWKARGVMQITPIAAEEMDVDYETLTDPEINIKVGTEYLSELTEDFDEVEDALLAYNAGPTKIRSWIRKGRPKYVSDEETPRLKWQKNAFPYVEKILSKLQDNTETTEEINE